MANRFSDIAKQMVANVNEEAAPETEPQPLEVEDPPRSAANDETTPPPIKPPQKALGIPAPSGTEIPTTRKTTALPLVFDIAIKEVKERRNIASKIKKSKKITEDDVVVEALELYFKKAENKSYLDAAYEKLKNFE
jgi:hypothetical protein